MRVRHPADDFLPLEDVFGDLRRHQVDGVVLADGSHGVAVLNPALLEDVRVGGVAHKGRPAKGIIVEAVQPLELLGVPFHQRDVVANALQVAHQRGAYLVAADHQNVHGSHLMLSTL